MFSYIESIDGNSNFFQFKITKTQFLIPLYNYVTVHLCNYKPDPSSIISHLFLLVATIRSQAQNTRLGGFIPTGVLNVSFMM